MSRYRGVKERTTAIMVEKWSTAHATALKAEGRDPSAIAGQPLVVSVDFGYMEPEELYAAARAIGRWAASLEAQAIKELDRKAQAPLFEL